MRVLAGLSIVLVIGGLAGPVFAQNSAASIATETTLLSSLTAPKFGPFTLKAGIRSTSSSGRFAEYQDIAGRLYRLQNEYFAGLIHSSGWGLVGTAITIGKSFIDPDKETAIGAGDPSVTLEHPALLADGTNRVWGQLRRYFAVTDLSKATNLDQYAYYLFATRKLAGGSELFNVAIVRSFMRSINKPSDTIYVFDDTSKFIYKVNSWLKLGLAQRTQFEWHDVTPMGQSVEIAPFANLVLNKNAFLEPRFVMPVHKVNEVYETAPSVGFSGAMAELMLQVSI